MIGNLKPIKLIQYTQAIDNNGDAAESIQTVYKMWAEITDDGGSKSMEFGRTAMSDTKTFKINFRNYLVTGDYKIQYFGQTYAVTSIKRIQEKRFNYEITAFNTFEVSTGGVPVSPVLFETMSYDQVNGVLQFTDGNLGGAYLQILIKNPTTGANYYNRWNEFISTPGPGPINELEYPYFTPNDNILIKWYFIAPGSPTPITPTNEQVITCNRLCIRNFRLFEYGVQDSPLYYTFLTTGVYPYNVNGDQLGIVYSIEDYISAMNADPINSQYFTITDYELTMGGQYPGTYLLECSPVDPYYQWNPADTLLYLEAQIA